MQIELELKLLGEEGFDVEALLTALAGVAALSPPNRRTVRDIYMDTRARSLTRAGLSARHRLDGRKAKVQLKAVLLLPELIQKRPELGAPLGRGEDPARAIKRLAEENLEITLRGLPTPELEVKRMRTSYEITGPEGGQAVLDIDEAMALLPGRRKGPTFIEVELAFVSGEEADFRRLVEVMVALPGLRPSKRSKHLRSRDLLGLEPHVLAAPPVSFEHGDPVDRVAREICQRLWASVRAHEPGTRLGLDLEYLHKMRVSTRRLRAALGAFDGCFTRAEQEYLQRNLRWLAALLGEVRDLDVQLLDLRAHRARLGSEPAQGWEELRSQLQAQHAMARRRMIQALDTTRYERLCGRALAVFGTKPRRRGVHAGQVPAAMLARQVVGRRGRQVLKAARRSDRDGAPERVHELRIKGKKLRYVAEFCAPLYGANFKKRVKGMARFQDLLGLFNDACVLGVQATTLREQALVTGGSPAFLNVLGRLEAYSLLTADAAQAQVRGAFDELGGRSAVVELIKEATREARKLEQQLERQRQRAEKQRRRAEKQRRKAERARRMAEEARRRAVAAGAGLRVALGKRR